MNKSLNKRILVVGVACIIVVLVGITSAYSTYTARLKITSQSQTIPVFQPEAQMLLQATQPKVALALAKKSNTGTITGTSTKTSAVAKTVALPYTFDTSVCSEGGDVNRFECLQNMYQKLVDTYSVDVAFTDLKKRFDIDPYVASECHPLSHVIGREATKIYPDVSNAYLHGDSFCWSGYYHGVMEGIVTKIGEANLPTQINTICSNIPGKNTYSFDYFNCVHGLGHGIMELKDDDVPISLNSCDNLVGNWEQSSCYSGVFMENIISYDRSGTSKYLKTTDPLYPCDSVDTKYKYQCYLGQTSFALQVNAFDFPKIFELCASVEEPFRDICNQSMGRDGANFDMHDALKTKATCSLAVDQNDKTNCIVGAVKEIVSYYHSDVQAKAFCGILDNADQANCFSTGEAYYKYF
jgi:hypothetical protein